jgi:hypothetical protein
MNFVAADTKSAIPNLVITTASLHEVRVSSSPALVTRTNLKILVLGEI